MAGMLRSGNCPTAACARRIYDGDGDDDDDGDKDVDDCQSCERRSVFFV